MKDPLKAKHLKKALDGLAEEGVTQLFRPMIGADFIVGAVGQLQFEVMADRLQNEYALEVIFEPSPFAEARWVSGAKADVEDFIGKHRGAMGTDLDDQPVYLAKSSWDVGYVTERFPKLSIPADEGAGVTPHALATASPLLPSSRNPPDRAGVGRSSPCSSAATVRDG